MKKEYCGMPMRFAHTGVTQFAPENTLEAFKKAAELGFEGIELDIQLSGDGEIIVTHNDNMGYMTFERHRNRLREMTAEQIKAFDIPYRDALKLKYPPYPWTEHDGGRRMIMPPDYREERVTHLITFPEFDDRCAQRYLIDRHFFRCVPRYQQVFVKSSRRFFKKLCHTLLHVCQCSK